MISQVRTRWRQDRLPLLLYLLTFIVMSYPFLLRMHDHLPLINIDTQTALWQNWWMREALGRGDDVAQTSLLFYPAGLDLTLQPRRWSTFPLWSLLYSALGDPLAFNLTAMFGILFKAYGMYLVGLFLFKNRIPAWVCGAFYSFAAANLTFALQQPNTGATEWIPWFMLAFLYVLSQVAKKRDVRSLVPITVVAAFLFSLNAYANLKIAMFAILLGGSFAALYAISHQLWRLRRFWITMLVFGLSATFLLAPILVPYLQSKHLDISALDPVLTGRQGGVDALSYLKLYHDYPVAYSQIIDSIGTSSPRIQNVQGHVYHVGLVSIAFASMGIVYAYKVDRSAAVWLVLVLAFLLLSFGVEFYFSAHRIDTYWTPYRILQDNLFFRIIKHPARMSLVFLFPYAILIGHGLQYRLRTLVLGPLQCVLLTVSIIMLLYGTSIFPIVVRPAARPHYLSVLNDLVDGAIINVPFGRQESKYYMSLQRFHRRPIVEGMIARMPPNSYGYIDSNVFLSYLKEPEKVNLEDLTADDLYAALAQLRDDGFRYLVLHQRISRKVDRVVQTVDGWMLELFTKEQALYVDDEVLIYDIAALGHRLSHTV